jgi:hypothetical protein
MSFLYPHAAKFGPVDLRKWNPATKNLDVPTVVYVYAAGTTNRATLYTDATRATTATNNPVATGVTSNTAGLDALGNLIFYAEADDYDILVDGQRYTVRALPTNADVQATAGSGFDPSTYLNF